MLGEVTLLPTHVLLEVDIAALNERQAFASWVLLDVLLPGLRG